MKAIRLVVNLETTSGLKIQDTVEYHKAFEGQKIVWPDISKFPRFSIERTGLYLGNTGYIFQTEHLWLSAYLGSRCCWFIVANTAISLGERAGLPRYRLIDQYMRKIPIPDVSEQQQAILTDYSLVIANFASTRYALHQQVRHRIQADLGTAGVVLNQKLTAWWDLPDFAAFRAEVKKALKSDVPLRERHEWEGYLRAEQAEHARLTAEIIRLETELNAQVYRLFDLTPDEIALIESTTKFRYGEV